MKAHHAVRHHHGIVHGIEHGVKAVGNTTTRVMNKVFRK
jgi:hypothetical protein